MILIKAVNRPPEVFDFDGAPLVKPLATNPYVLNSVKLYLIFVGPNWYQNNSPTTFVHDMSGRAEEILNSAYLKGLRQYGSDGIATYTDFYVDVGLDPVVWSMDYVLPNGQIVHSTNPDFFETNQILENSLFPSWQPGGGDARNSPIYVVVRYTQNGSNGGGGYGGSNDFGPNPPFTSLPINVIDVALTTADQVDQFTWVFSHEVVERISTGIGNQSTTGVFEITPDAGGQIADGEPEGPGFYAWRLNGSEGPLVTSYWSVVDQAYIVPDGGARVLLDPIWNGGSFAGLASLQQASLFLYQNSGNAVRTLIDTKVASYAIISAGSTARIFDLTVDRQVKAYGGSGTNWNVISATNMTAFALTATSDGNLYALANTHFRGASSGWRYGGSGTNWTTITPSNMSVTSMVSAGPKLYALGITARHSQVWEYSGTGTNWTPITTTDVKVLQILSANGAIYMLVEAGGGNELQAYTSSGTNWTTVTDATFKVLQVAAADDAVFMVAGKDGGTNLVWRYDGVGSSWSQIFGPGANVGSMAILDGVNLCVLASTSDGPNQVFQFNGTPYDWTALTDMNWIVVSIDNNNNRLHMKASNDLGRSYPEWTYSGTPNQWLAGAQ